MSDRPPDCPLTRRQWQIMLLLADGMTGQEIALHLGMSPSTVRRHSHGAFQRLGVPNTAAAVAAIYRNGWVGYEVPPKPDRWPPLVRSYLEALDRYLATGDPRAREAMSIAVGGMRDGARA